MRLLKASTTVTVQLGPALDKTDGVTEETALSPTVEVSKAGGVFAARNSATAITHDANGWYRVELNATDTNTIGPLLAKFDDAATHLPVWHEFMVLPANVYDSLVGGTDTLDVQVTGMGADVVTAAAIATDAVAEIADQVWDEARAGHVAAGSFGEGVASVQGNITGSVGSVATGGITAGSIAADAIGASELAADAVAEIADGVWDEARSGHVTAGTFGEGVASVQGNVTGSAASVTGAVGSVTAAVTVGTNNDKSGYALSAAGVDAILDDSISEPAGIFTWPATPRNILSWLGVITRNRKTQTATTTSYRNDADTLTLATRTVSDDGTTFVSGEAT